MTRPIFKTNYYRTPKNYYKQWEGKRTKESILREIFNRIDEFLWEFDNYLEVLVQNMIIDKKDKKDFINQLTDGLYEKILLNAIVEIEDLNLGEDYLQDYFKTINQTKNKLQKLQRTTEKELYDNLKPQIVFPTPPLYHLGHKNNGKNKKTKRLEPKRKPGRPKLAY